MVDVAEAVNVIAPVPVVNISENLTDKEFLTLEPYTVKGFIILLVIAPLIALPPVVRPEIRE
jgi:hypothetical protein